MQRPSNAIFYVIGSILLLFGLYIGGTLILEARQEAELEGAIEEDASFKESRIRLELES